MPTALPTEAHQARTRLRQHARALLRAPHNTDACMARLQCAAELPGSEPVQGALADIFTLFGEASATFKRAALQSVQPRLATHVARWFEAQVERPMLPRISPLATRWSVFARPSADTSVRARCCSVDDSRALAAKVIATLSNEDTAAQQAFLHHCVTCHDNLAFMLARRALLSRGAPLPAEWLAVSQQLEKPRELA